MAAGLVIGCVAEDELSDFDRMEEELELELEDELELTAEPSDPAPNGAAESAPAAAAELVASDDPLESPGAPCSIIDSNGPLPGGTTTIIGCEEGELCVAYACGGYSCAGTCQTGGGIFLPK